jgi:hypothetical protein
MLVLGCGRPAPPHVVPEPPAPPGPSSACRIGTPGAPAPDTITVVVPPSDSAAVAAANEFDTLIRLDCEGRPVPGLASSWARDSTGTIWTFLFPESQLSGAGDVASAWKSSETASALLSQSGVREASPDGQRLVIRLEQPAESVPAVFADHALGVRRHASPPTIVVRSTEGRDARDLVDQSPDVLVTEDPDVLDYASRRPGTTLAALPWDRVYVLLLAPGGRPPRELISSDSTTLRMQLARDAVRSEARPAQPPYWWSDLRGCAASATPVPVEAGPGAEASIGYPAGDAAARSLAERIVALGDSSWFARGLAAHDFQASLRASAMTAYILPLPIRSLVPCRDAMWPAGATLAPLVETRRTAILRQNGPALVAGGDGSLRPYPTSGEP